MKTFVLILMGLGAMILLASCYIPFGADRELNKIATEYGGVYVFDKKFRDEIIQREKDREEYRKNRSNQIDEEKERILRTLFTEEELQIARDEEERHKKKIFYRTYYKITTKKEEEEHFKRVLEVYPKVKEKRNEILEDLWDNKYPDLVEEKFPRVLSNGCKYFVKGMSKKELEETDLTPYYQKIEEYMGEEVFEKLKSSLVVSCYYIDEKGKVIPISVDTWIRDVITKFGLYGDEGRGFHFSQNYIVDAGRNKHIHYLIDDKFVRGELTEGKRW